ncbi:hypothetical protein Amet_4163 [Alkaliphilus metalliredigens QYMF]|uniref:ABC-2 type transporter transmembrane domain-containing protein n=1 Tax=Alkaliphilus metalliredigens (strain QYMF) TaxID=293826 RepID=A6TVM6_ALKMQ|nr:ABC transporter permease [Alkaliphilus metalliredigens]ABR50244.1 hypothetical protein Amet_4163 [Alkaliphilus metalliredigens QYMF]
MKYLYSFMAIFHKEWIELKRYWLNSLIGFIIYIIIFIALFTGAQYIGQANVALTESLEGFLIGYTLWFMAMGAFSDTAHAIVDEARKGTLEQLYMTEIPFVWLLVSKNIVSTLFFTVFFIVMIYVQMILTGIQLHVDLLGIFVVLFVGLFSLYGVGLLLAGLGLVFKKIQNIMGATQFIIVGLMMVSPTDKPILKLLPFTYTRELIMKMLQEGKGLQNFSSEDYGFLLFTSVLYMSIGMYGYKVAEKEVLKRGMLGQY